MISNNNIDLLMILVGYLQFTIWTNIGVDHIKPLIQKHTAARTIARIKNFRNMSQHDHITPTLKDIQWLTFIDQDLPTFSVQR